MNRVSLIGNLTRDVEIKTLQSGAIVGNTSIATNKKYKNKAGETISEVAFHNLTLWNKSAEIFAQYMHKGSKVFVEGELKYDEWEKDGVKRVLTKIVVNNFEFLDSKPQNSQVNNQSSGQYSQPAQNNAPQNNAPQNNDQEKFPADNNSGGDEEHIDISQIPF